MDPADDQPEAGPSRPRQTIAPQPETPKSRRKSWFGFGFSAPSGAVNSSPSAESPRRNSALDLMERDYKEAGSVKRLEGFGSRKDGIMIGVEQESLVIEGSPDTLKKKKKKRKSKDDVDDLEMQDMDAVQMDSVNMKRRGSSKSTVRPSMETFVTANDMLDQTPRASVIFSEYGTAEDIEVEPQKVTTKIRGSPRPAVPPKPSHRSSSLTTSSLLGPPTPPKPPDLPSQPIRASLDKITPPLPTERPLPALPDSPTRRMSDEVTETDIRIIPSTPVKLKKQSIRRHTTSLQHPLKDLSTSARSSPNAFRSSSQSRSMLKHKSSKIGLGLPGSLVASPEKDQEKSLSPMKKKVAVSTPVSSRPTSPAPKISFTAPEEDSMIEKGGSVAIEGRREPRRARSFSGLLSKSSASSSAASINREGIGKGAEANTDDKDKTIDREEGVELRKSSGILEWLGMKKGKRRGSDGKALEKVSAKEKEKEDQEEQGVVQAESMKHEVEEDNNNEDRGRSRKLSEGRANVVGSSEILRTANSPSRAAESSSRPSSGHSTPPTSRPIPILGSRNRATSSNISLQIPIESPRFAQTDIHDSPASEKEEHLFQPPSAPWVDYLSSNENSSQSSPKDTTPVAAIIIDKKSKGKEGRIRSWSDAPQPSFALLQSGKSPASASITKSTSRSVQNSPNLSSVGVPSPGRPKLGSRTHSGNSVIMEKMKGVFSSSSRNRSRSRSLLPGDKGDQSDGVDEFGVATSSRLGRSAGSAVSLLGNKNRKDESWAADGLPNASLLDLHHGGRTAYLNDTPQRSPRTSFTGTYKSNTSNSTAQSTVSAIPASSVKSDMPPPSLPQLPKSRARASTVSFAPSTTSALSQSLLPPPSSPSPSFIPIAATPPSRRPSVISRISSGLLGTSPGGGGSGFISSSPKGSLFPLPPRSSGSTMSSTPGMEDSMISSNTGNTSGTSLLTSPGTSPRPSTGSYIREGLKAVIKIEEGDTSESWLDRIQKVAGRDEIAGILASSGDSLHQDALRSYIGQFNFTHNALDVALRRLLMVMTLPKETQQIDRVVEAFSNRYEACEPGLFGSADNTYILAFSMMMLHTDAFNKNNKNKMTKADYVRNTRLNGVNPIILEAFYDNITYTPFIYIDDNGESHLGMPSASSASASGQASGNRSRSGSDAITPPVPSILSTPTTPATISSVNLTTPKSAGKIDVYQRIQSGTIATLRVDIESAINPVNPLIGMGNSLTVDMEKIHDSFIDAAIMKVGQDNHFMGKRRPHTSGNSGVSKRGSQELLKKQHGVNGVEGDNEIALRVTKVGLLSRRDEIGETRKLQKKWKSWSVLLTGSQLLFVKDPFWAMTLASNLKEARMAGSGHIILPKVDRFLPEEVLSLKDAIAVYDPSLGISNTFKLHFPHRQYLIQTSDETSMNEWIHLINYAAAFKTANIRIRSGMMRRDDAVLAGAAAASSVKREITARSESLGKPSGRDLAEDKTGTFEARFPVKSFGTPMRPSVRSDSDPAEILAPVVKVDESPDPGTGSIQSGRSTPLQSILQKPPSILSIERPASAASMRSSLGGPPSLATPSEEVLDDASERLGEVFSVVKAEIAVNAAGQRGRQTSGESVGSVGRPRVRVTSSTQANRTRLMESQIKEYETRLASAQHNLSQHMIQARNLAILTPFLKTTRDRIISAVAPLSHKIRSDRLQITKYSTWIFILKKDMERDGYEWKTTKNVALQAAAESLNPSKQAKNGALTSLISQDDGEPIPNRGQQRELKDTPALSLGDIASPAFSGTEWPSESAVSQDDIPHQEAPRPDSPVYELPVMIRQESDQGRMYEGGDLAKRPEYRRHVSAGPSTILEDEEESRKSLGRTSLRKSTSDLLKVMQ